MTFTELRVEGAYLLGPDIVSDHRGHYVRCWRRHEFESRGLPTHFAQANLVSSRRRGTLRGLHWQLAPHDEAKIVICTIGRIFDVVVDTRAGSSTFGRWAGATLSSADHAMVYVPPGCAHGLLTLEDDTQVLYSSSAAYAPDAQQGLRYDDAAVGIEWPADIVEVSEKDLSWPPLTRRS